MRELIDVVEKFLELCDELYSDKKIDKKLYEEITKKKIKFLNDIKKAV